MKIEWIFHHNPDLILYGEDGSQEKSIDLANYNYEQLHELFKTHFRTKEMVGGRRLYAVNGSTSSLETPPLLNDASAPQPDSLGWRLADTLAEWVSCCDSLQQALLYLVLGGALMALLAKMLLSASSRRQRVRTSKDTATSEDTAGVCHIA